MCPSWRRKLFCSHTHAYIYTLSLSLCRYIFLYILCIFSFYSQSSFSFFLSLILARTHSTVFTHIPFTHTRSSPGNTLNYIYIYCIYIKVHGLSIRSNSQCISSPHFRRTIFSSLSATRSPRYERRDRRFVHFPYSEKYELVSRETYLPKNRILLYTHKLSDVSRIVASRSHAHGGRRKDKKYCRRSSVEEDVRETLCKAAKNFSLPPSSTNVMSDHTLVNELPSASKCLLNQTSPG